MKKTIKFLFSLSLLIASYFLIQSAGAVTTSTPTISDLNVKTTRTTAEISWSAVDEDRISGVNFTYGLTENYGSTSTVRVTYSVTSSSVEYFFATLIENLQPGTQIYYKIEVYNPEKQSATHVGSFTTAPPDTIPPVISRITATPQSRSATIGWDTNEDADSEVKYWSDGSAPVVKSDKDLTTEHFVYLGNLEQNTSYHFQVTSHDSAGNKAASGEQTFRTLNKILPPSDVSNLSLSTTGTALLLKWRNPQEARFSRVDVVRKIGSQANSEADGEIVYSGRGETFIDKKILSGRQYFYTVYTLDSAQTISGGVTVAGSLGGSAALSGPPPVTVSSSLKLQPTDFKFYTARRTRELPIINGVVTDNPDSNFTIGLPADKLSLVPQSIVLKLGGMIHQFSAPVEQNTFYADFPFHASGRGEAYVQVDYANGQTDVIPFVFVAEGPSLAPPVQVPVVVEPPKPVEKAPEPKPAVIEQITQTAAVIKDFTEKEEVKQTVSTVVAPTIVGVAAVSTASAVSWFNIVPFFQLILFQPFVFLSRRRRHAWGLVYNSLTKMPVDLAVVRLVSKESGRVVQSKVTDSQGRYAFVANPGKYIIQVVKGKFVFPSAMLREVKDDGQKVDIYHGETITITDADALIASNIPLDPAGEFHKPARLKWQKMLHTAQATFSWAGLVIMLASLYISPKWYMWVLLAVHVLSLVLLRRLAAPPKIKSWGIVSDVHSKKPLDHAVARLYNLQFNKLVATQITDNRGRYYFLAGDGEYYVTFDHPGYAARKSPVLNLKGRAAQTVAFDIALKPQA